MPAQRKYPEELIERAVRMVAEKQRQTPAPDCDLGHRARIAPPQSRPDRRDVTVRRPG
jgi:hypothetical protein